MISFVELVHLFKNVSNDSPERVASTFEGFINSYDKSNNTVTVWIPYLTNPNTPDKSFVTPPLPFGTPMVGNGYGVRFYPPFGMPCLVLFVERTVGTAVVCIPHYNDALPPNADVNFNEDLQPGELEIVGVPSAGGGRSASVKLDANGQLLLNGHNKTTTGVPVAVEGSTATHHHGLQQFFTAIEAALNLIGSTPLTGTSLAGVFTGLTGTTGETDDTSAAIDTGQGAQSVRTVGPSQS